MVLSEQLDTSDFPPTDLWSERLRFLTPEGEVVPAPNEAAIQERQRAERAEALLAAERQRSQALEARLRELEEKDEG